MSMDLKSLREYKIPFHEFQLHWRFDDESYSKLSHIHLAQIQPVTTDVANFLWKYSSGVANNLKNYQGFSFFSEIDTQDKTLKKWLFHRGLAFKKDIYIVWQPDIAVLTTWKIFIKFFNDFYYFPDEILVFDNSLNWGILIHNEKVLFGSNKHD